jgi:hypothetical protein
LKTQSLIRILYLPRADIAGYGFLFAKDPATSRAQSTNSCAVGLSVRFLAVTIATDLRVVGKWMGNALIAGFVTGNLKTDSGTMVRNRPFAASALRAGLV